MPMPRLTFDGSESLAALALRLHALFGGGTMTRADVSTAILETENRSDTGARLRRHLDEGVASLVRCGVIEPEGEHFRLTARAAGFAAGRFAEIEREVERMAADFDPETPTEASAETQPAEGRGSDDPWAIDRVTRTFLEDVLRDADLPAGLLELIVQSYGENGRVRMSEDGRRYEISLPSAS